MVRSKKEILFQSVNYLIFTLFALICLYPFYYIFIYTVSNSQEAAKGGIYLLPHGFTLQNYRTVFMASGLVNAAFVSVARTVIGTVLTLLGSSFLGYLVTKKELPFRSFIYRFVITTMYLNAGLIPYYIVMKKIGLINNFLIYVVPGVISAYFVILIKTYIESIPPALEESAMIDGANFGTIYFKIILPLSQPILATVAVFSAVSQWNSFSDNLIFVTDTHLRTLQLMLYQILSSVTQLSTNMTTADLERMKNIVQPTPTTIRMTISMVVTFPILVVYPFLQRYFVKGIMLGAIKG